MGATGTAVGASSTGRVRTVSQFDAPLNDTLHDYRHQLLTRAKLLIASTCGKELEKMDDIPHQASVTLPSVAHEWDPGFAQQHPALTCSLNRVHLCCVRTQLHLPRLPGPRSAAMIAEVLLQEASRLNARALVVASHGPGTTLCDGTVGTHTLLRGFVKAKALLHRTGSEHDTKHIYVPKLACIRNLFRAN
jgi:hypothetical protein